ncbi:MAG: outer membrane lipoprotein chaperone LolA [Thermoanaerobaculia bacterium]
MSTMLRRVTRVLPLLLFVLPVAFAEGGEVDLAIPALTGYEADFVQKFTPKGFRNPQIEKGSVTFGKLPRMRWSYVSPEAKTFVFDGETSWLYTPAERQAYRKKLGAADKAELPFLVMSSGQAMTRAYTVRERKSGGAITVTLKPRAANSALREITLTTAAADHRIRRLEYADRQGNRTVFEFSNYRKASTDATTFTFRPPGGVEVVEQ